MKHLPANLPIPETRIRNRRHGANAPPPLATAALRWRRRRIVDVKIHESVGREEWRFVRATAGDETGRVVASVFTRTNLSTKDLKSNFGA